MPNNNSKVIHGRIYNIFGICNYMLMDIALNGNMDKFCLQLWKKQKFVDITLTFHNLNKDSKF